MKFLLSTLLLAIIMPITNANAALPADNPFAQPSPLPYQLPQFDKIKAEHFIPAYEAAMAEQRREVEAITQNPAPPTFDNVIVALERCGTMLARVSSAFANLNASNTSDELQKIDTLMSPRLTAHYDAISMDPALFARINALYSQKSGLKLDAEAAQLLERYYQQFVRSGALLSEADKATLKNINKKLSSLGTQFEQNLLKSTKDGAVVVDRVAELDGFSAEQVGAAAEAAKAAGLTGKWLISLQNTTIQPPLAQLKNRALRERIYHASIARNNGGRADNTALVSEMVKLRAQQAASAGLSQLRRLFSGRRKRQNHAGRQRHSVKAGAAGPAQGPAGRRRHPASD